MAEGATVKRRGLMAAAVQQPVPPPLPTSKSTTATLSVPTLPQARP